MIAAPNVNVKRKRLVIVPSTRNAILNINVKKQRLTVVVVANVSVKKIAHQKLRRKKQSLKRRYDLIVI